MPTGQSSSIGQSLLPSRFLPTELLSNLPAGGILNTGGSFSQNLSKLSSLTSGSLSCTHDLGPQNAVLTESLGSGSPAANALNSSESLIIKTISPSFVQGPTTLILQKTPFLTPDTTTQRTPAQSSMTDPFDGISPDSETSEPNTCSVELQDIIRRKPAQIWLISQLQRPQRPQLLASQH